MSKQVKDILTRELAARYGEATNAVWVEMIGVDGIVTNNFRRDLRARHMKLEVVKTSLLQRACQDGPMARLAGALGGPVALLTGGETAIDAAKALEEWLPKFPKNAVKLRGALLEGEFLDEAQVQDLAKMPGKRDLQAQLVAMVLSPGGKLVSAILSGGGNVAGCLKAMIDKLEKDEPVAKAS
jgi:large subunit ribosomal protein L10